MKPAAHLGVSRWERLRTIDPRIRDSLLGVATLALALTQRSRTTPGRASPTSSPWRSSRWEPSP